MLQRKIRLIILSLISLTFIGILVFLILPYFNIAFFDFQCKTGGCSGQICSANPLEYSRHTTCEMRIEYGCLTDCRVRNFRCKFDPIFRKECIERIEENWYD